MPGSRESRVMVLRTAHLAAEAGRWPRRSSLGGSIVTTTNDSAGRIGRVSIAERCPQVQCKADEEKCRCAGKSCQSGAAPRGCCRALLLAEARNCFWVD